MCLLAASSLLIGVRIRAADKLTGGKKNAAAAVVVTSSSLAITATTTAQHQKKTCPSKLASLQVSQPYNTQIDIHGKHMIVVTREFKTTHVHVIFYTRNDMVVYTEVITYLNNNYWQYLIIL